MESTNGETKNALFFLDTEEVGSSSLLEPTIAKDADSSTSTAAAAESASPSGPTLGPIDPGLEPHQREYWLHPANHTAGVKVASGPTILLASGRYFDLLDPFGSEFDITDIAAALGKICRFTGHCRRFYSVAEHSVMCSRYAPARELRAACLLHDAAEAFIGDVSRPLKQLLPEYKRIETRIEAVITYHFRDVLAGVSLSDPRVKKLDASMCRLERMQLMPETQSDWSYGAELMDLPGVALMCWDPASASAAFLIEAKRLGIGGGAL